MFPSPDNMVRIKNFSVNHKIFKVAVSHDNNVSMLSIVVTISICRGIYLAYLCSFLPLMSIQQDLTMFSATPCWIHFAISTFSMTTWSFLVIFVQHRSILCNEAKASGVWERCSGRNSLSTSLFSKFLSSKKLAETPWMPNVTYKTGQVVYVECSANARIKEYYKLLSLHESSSKSCPSKKNIVRGSLDCLLIGETNMEYSTIYRLLIIVMNFICVLEAFLAFFFPKGVSFLLTSLIDLVIVFHLRHYFFSRKRYIDNVEGNGHEEMVHMNKFGKVESYTEFNSDAANHDSACSRTVSFSSSSTKKSNPSKKKKQLS